MSGLLDKASAAKKAESSDAEGKKPQEIEGKAIEMKADGKIRSISNDPASENAMKIGLAGWVIILVGAILSLQGGSWGVIVVSIVLVVGIGAIVYADRMRGSLSTPKLAASVIVAMLVAVGPIFMFHFFPSNANIAITDISIDEENDELDFAIRGSFNSVDLEISSGDEVLWEGSEELSNNIKRVGVPIQDFFDGNAERFDGTVIKTYTITATSSNGNTVEMDINSKLLTRQAFNGGVQFTPYVSFSNSGQGGESTHEGVRVQAFVGLFGDGERAMDDGVHSYASSNQRAFTGQQTYTLTVSSPDNSISYTHPTVTINGDVAKWVSSHSGASSSETAVGFVPLGGTDVDNDGLEFIERNRFYDEGGCYDFTLTVTNVNLGNDHSTTFTVTNSWEINWDEDDAPEERNSYPVC